MTAFRDVLLRTLAIIEDAGACPATPALEPDARGRVLVDGVRCTNFASNDYLGLSRHPAVLEALEWGASLGLGSGGSRMTAGTHRVHHQLEERLAAFKRAEDAVVFSAGFLANVGVLSAIAGQTLQGLAQTLSPDGLADLDGATEVFADELVHASILDGLALASSRLSPRRARLRFYRHLDLADLEQQLAASTTARRLVVTDGVFSLHGHLAPLDELTALARRHGAALYVDDAHGTGVFGANGRGTPEHFGVEADVDFRVGTFSKALGGAGGFVVGDADVCKYLRVAARSALYQTSMPPVVAAGLIAALDTLQREPERRVRVLKNAAWLRAELTGLGFDLLGSTTQIIPVCLGSTGRALDAAQALRQRGLFAPAYYYPVVRRREAMVRINVTAEHTLEDFERLLDALAPFAPGAEPEPEPVVDFSVAGFSAARPSSPPPPA